MITTTPVSPSSRAEVLALLFLATVAGGCSGGRKATDPVILPPAPTVGQVTISGTLSAGLVAPVTSAPLPSSLRAAPPEAKWDGSGPATPASLSDPVTAPSALAGYQLSCVTFSDPPSSGSATIGSSGTFSLTFAAQGVPFGCFVLDPAGALVAFVTFTSDAGTSQAITLGGDTSLGTIAVDPTTGLARTVSGLTSAVLSRAAGPGVCPVGNWTFATAYAGACPSITSLAGTLSVVRDPVGPTTANITAAPVGPGCGPRSVAGVPVAFETGIVTIGPFVLDPECPERTSLLAMAPDAACGRLEGTITTSGCSGACSGCGTQSWSQIAQGPATYAISGTVSGSADAGVTVALTGAAAATTVTDTTGRYTFADLAEGAYAVTPSLAGYAFAPAGRVVTVVGGNTDGAGFTARSVPLTSAISGTLSGPTVDGVVVVLGGAAAGRTLSDAAGHYRFTGLADGTYSVEPVLAGHSFTPSRPAVVLAGADLPAEDFTGRAYPTQVIALPGQGQATVSWTGVAGSSSYRVYASTTTPVTSQDPAISVTGSPATVTALANGVPHYFAVAAVDDAGESALSPIACAVPSAADTAGLVLHDSLCEAFIDGTKWLNQGIGTGYSVGVVGGAAELSVAMSHQPSGEPYYGGMLSVNAGGRRVTTLQFDLTLPSALAWTAGKSQIKASTNLRYATAGYGEWLDLQLGLIDDGTGLQAFRQLVHCTPAMCTAEGVVLDDPLAFTFNPGWPMARGPAAYDTTYTLSVSLDETSSRLTWSIAGGNFGAGATGTVDPAAYLASAPSWGGSIAAGFQEANLEVRTQDDSPAGGGAGAITARLGNVLVGLDGAPATPYDDFSGAGDNSGASELSLAKWINGGSHAVQAEGGSVHLRNAFTAPSVAGFARGTSLILVDPTVIAFQVDLDLTRCDPVGVSETSVCNQGISALLFNDGSAGSAPVEPGSNAGDIVVVLLVNPIADHAYFALLRCTGAAPGCQNTVTLGISTMPRASPEVPLLGPHTFLIGWDPVTSLLRVGIDAERVVVDLTRAGPYLSEALPNLAPARSPAINITNETIMSPGPTAAGGHMSSDLRVNNVFVARR
jgi:hypothetical protein